MHKIKFLLLISLFISTHQATAVVEGGAKPMEPASNANFYSEEELTNVELTSKSISPNSKIRFTKSFYIDAGENCSKAGNCNVCHVKKNAAFKPDDFLKPFNVHKDGLITELPYITGNSYELSFKDPEGMNYVLLCYDIRIETSIGETVKYLKRHGIIVDVLKAVEGIHLEKKPAEPATTTSAKDRHPPTRRPAASGN